MATEARAQLVSGPNGEDLIEIEILGLDAFRVYALDPLVGERLLYDLHGICQTLRGVKKPLRWRDRVQKMRKAARGS